MANEISNYAWSGPAADTFSDAGNALRKTGDAVKAVLNDCANKMNSTANNYIANQNANTKNLCVKTTTTTTTTTGGGTPNTTAGAANTTTTTAGSGSSPHDTPKTSPHTPKASPRDTPK